MAVRTRQFGPFTLGTSTTTLYTVPSGRTMLIRCVTFYVVQAGTPNWAFAIGSGGTDYYFLRINAMANTSSLTINYDALVLNPGMTLRGFCSVAGNWATVSGSLLDGAPS